MQVRLLGAMEVAADDGTPVPVSGQKLRALLAVLALSCGRVVATDRLISDLWGDDQPAGVANALQRLVSKLRKALGDGDVIVTRSPGYVLSVDERDVDVFLLDQQVAAGRAAAAAGDVDRAVTLLTEAERLWRGPALADFVYDDFAQPHITRLEELRLSLVEDRTEADIARGRHAAVVSELEVLVAEHPLRERLRQQLMVALYRSGRQADALRVFQVGRAALADELGLDPGPELRRLEAAILTQDPSLDAPAGPVTPAPTRRRSPVKAALTPLVGRTEELANVTALLCEHRLVTLVGPGGAGKTRLAVEAARRLDESFDDGAVVVELAPITDPAAIARGVATALDLPESDADALARICQHCRDRDLLLLLDNCEHLVEAAARLADDVLGACGGIRILATSREALRVNGEAIWPVPPLAEADACTLFVQRAVAAEPSFAVDDEGLVAEICGRLDGLPLAIELAAARTRAFPLRQIAERLDDRFRLLTAGVRTALPRHQTLRGVVDWSYDLLFDDERRVFEALSVFPGGCALDAAQSVCATDGMTPDDVTDVIASLVDKSLLTVDRAGRAPRYVMLQTLSQYGRERLIERGEADHVHRRMAAHFATFADAGGAALRGAGQRDWLLDVVDEHDNLSAAFDWALAAGEAELVMRIAAGTAWQRWVAGTAGEGCRWLDAAFATQAPLPPALRASGLQWRAYLGFLVADSHDMDAQFEEAIELYRASGSLIDAALTLALYAQVASEQGRYAHAVAQIEQALTLLDSSPPATWNDAAATWLRAMRVVQRDGDFVTFEVLLREAIPKFVASGDEFMASIALGVVADFDERRGDHERADEALARALAVAVELRVGGLQSSLLARLGIVAARTGDFDRADDLLDRALTLADELGYPPVRAQALNGIANVRRRQGRLGEAEAAAQSALELYRGSFGTAFSARYRNVGYDVPGGAAVALSVLGYCAEARGDPDRAAARHGEALEQAMITTDKRAIAFALEGLACAVAASGDGERSARLLGTAAASRRDERAALAPTEAADVDRARRAATALIGAAAFEIAFDHGQATPPEDVLLSVSRWFTDV